MRFRVRSLALLRGLRIRHCCELWCSLQMRLGSGVAMAVAWVAAVAQATGVAGQRKRNPCGEESGWLLASNVVLDPTVLKRAAVFLEVEGDLGGGAASSCPHVVPLASRPDPSGHAGVPCGGDGGWPCVSCVELGSYLSMSVALKL